MGIGPVVSLKVREERDVNVTLRVRSLATGDTIIDAKGVAHLVHGRPNGPGCGPECFGGTVTYDPVTSQLLAP